MPSKKQYDLVMDDGAANLLGPAANEMEAVFRAGLNFQAKLIGTRDVQRPSSRVEIVAAMRRIRYECKVKSVKKKKVNIVISIDGVKVTSYKHGRKKRNSLDADDSGLLVHQHPIFRIFYVSHDSQDLLIFSYIARDETLDSFQCSVFKAYKKSQAVDIVRTIGQAFEVCHRMSLQAAAINRQEDGLSNTGSSDEHHQIKAQRGVECRSSSSDFPTCERRQSSANPDELISPYNEMSTFTLSLKNGSANCPSMRTDSLARSNSLATYSRVNCAKPKPMSPSQMSVSEHSARLLKEQLSLQTQQTEFLKTEVQLLRDRLTAETAARISSQTRTRELMMQNHELLDHIDVLVSRLAELEAVSGSLEASSVHRLTRLPSVCSQVSSFVEPSSPQPINNSLYLEPANQKPAFQPLAYRQTASVIPDSTSGPSRLTNGLGCMETVESYGATGTDSSGSESRTPVPSETSVVEYRLSRSDIGDQLQRPSRLPVAKHSSIIVPSPLQDATGNRLQLTLPLPPRLKPPPRVTRQQTADVCFRNSSLSTTAADKRFSWSYAPKSSLVSSPQNGGKLVNTLPRPRRAEVGTVLNCSAYTINSSVPASSSEASYSLDTTVPLVSGRMSERLAEISTCDECSFDSTAELKLSFSDDECFVEAVSKKST